MATRSQSLQNFSEKTSDLINSKFIVAEKKISEVLICISDSVLLFELFQHVTADFDYSTVKKICFSHDAQGNGFFRLPKGDADVLALGLSILSEIDNGEIDLVDLCTEYFPSPEGKQRSYSIFATQLLIPFQQTTLKLAKTILESENGVFANDEKEVDPLEEVKELISDFGKTVKNEQVSEFPYIKQLVKEIDQVIATTNNVEPYVDLKFALLEYQEYIQSKNYRGIILAQLAIAYIAQKAKKVKVDNNKLAALILEIQV